MRSCAPHRRLRFFIAPFLVALCLAAIGCAQTQYRGRDVTRHVALRGSEVQPAPPSAKQPVPLVRARSVAATEPEIKALQAEANAAFFAEMASAPDATFVEGAAELERCRLRVVLRRAHTFYTARCRAVWKLHDVVLARVEAEARRRVRSQTFTEDEARAIKPGARHPAILQSESKEAMRSGATWAARLLRDPTADPPVFNEDDQRTRTQTIAARPVTRALARADLNHRRAERRAAACIDLLTLGEPGDGARVAPLLDAPELLVRRSAAKALEELAQSDDVDALFRHRNHPDEAVQQSVALALSRVIALNPTIVAPPLGPPPTIAEGAGATAEVNVVPPPKARIVIGSDDDKPPVESEAALPGPSTADGE